MDSGMQVVTLLTAIERILAAPVVSQLDFPTGTIPQWMDTVRYEDVKHCSDKQPVVLVGKFQPGDRLSILSNQGKRHEF